MTLPPPLPGISQNLCEPSCWSNLCRNSGCSETPTAQPLVPQWTLQYQAIIINTKSQGGMIQMGDLLVLLLPFFPLVFARESRGLCNYKVYNSDCLPYLVPSVQVVPQILDLFSITHSKDSPSESYMRSQINN